MNKIYIQKINKQYVGDDCVQIMIPFKEDVIMFNDKGVVLSCGVNSSKDVNNYLYDDRRKQFPYSNIPFHQSRVGIFNKVFYINQLLDFEKPYIRLTDSVIIESYAVKDKDEAFVMNKVISFDNKKSIIMTRDELNNFFNNSKTDGKYFINIDDDRLTLKEKFLIPSEDSIRSLLKEDICNCVKEFKKYKEMNGADFVVKDFLNNHPWFLDYIEQSIDFSDLNFINTDARLRDGVGIIVDFNTLSIKYVETFFIGFDRYEVNFIEVPIIKPSLEQLKNMNAKIVETKEPKISSKVNSKVLQKSMINEKNKF